MNSRGRWRNISSMDDIFHPLLLLNECRSLKMILIEAEEALMRAGNDPKSIRGIVATRIDKKKIDYLRDAEAQAFQGYQVRNAFTERQD